MKNWKILFLATAVLASTLVFSNCGSDSGSAPSSSSSSTSSSGGTPDTTAPVISSISPADGEAGTYLNASISVTFNEPMDTATVTTHDSTTCSGSIQVSADGFSTCIAMSSAAATASNSDRTFTITPAANLTASTAYQIKVANSVADAAGNALVAASTVSFETGTSIDDPALCDTTADLNAAIIAADDGDSGTDDYLAEECVLTDVVVTYVSGSAFTLQQVKSGPGTLIYKGGHGFSGGEKIPTFTVAITDIVELYYGMPEVKGYTITGGSTVVPLADFTTEIDQNTVFTDDNNATRVHFSGSGIITEVGAFQHKFSLGTGTFYIHKDSFPSVVAVGDSFKFTASGTAYVEYHSIAGYHYLKSVPADITVTEALRFASKSATRDSATNATLNYEVNYDGTAYYVVVADGAGAPSIAQIKAGQDSTGSAAIASGNKAYTKGSADNQAITSGISTGNAYDIYMVFNDGSSDIESGAIDLGNDVVAAASDLFISQYGEGASYNKFYEIFNGTGSSVTFDGNYYMMKITNPAAGTYDWSTANICLITGTIADNDVLVAYHSSAATAIQTVGDVTDSTCANFSGNDPIALVKDNNHDSAYDVGDTILDVIGDESGTDFAKDLGLVRKSSVSAPNSTYTLSEWDTQTSTDVDGAVDLGSHTYAP